MSHISNLYFIIAQIISICAQKTCSRRTIISDRSVGDNLYDDSTIQSWCATFEISPNCKCHPLRMIASCELLISQLVHQLRESAASIIDSTAYYKLYDSCCSQSSPIKMINILTNSNELNFHAGRSDLEFFIYKLSTFLLRARK